MPVSRRLLVASLWLLAMLAAPSAAVFAAAAQAVPVTVHYPSVEKADDDALEEYGLALLRLALARSGGHYRVEPSPARMQQNRALAELQSGSGRIDIVGTMTSREREDALLPVRIPMTRGLIGWRIALLRADQQHLLQQVRGLSDLKPLKAGQGRDWPDLEILRYAGLEVQPVAIYNALFGMLNAGRIDWAPRSVNEIWNEARLHPELVVDPYIVLRYPTADYFFVNRNNPALAEAVRRGLEAALADGSFQRLFNQHYGPLIRRARLDRRVLIELSNPLLSPQTPLGRKELWFTLDDLKRYR